MAAFKQEAEHTMSGQAITDRDLDIIFHDARSMNAWQDKPVPAELLKKIYESMKFGPTSANCCPLRIVFVTTQAGKDRLIPTLGEGNRAKVQQAPVTAILAYDTKFYEHLPFLFPHTDAKSWFAGNDKVIYDTAFRNSALQGAYFMIAARAHGLDCGPMSGFDADKLNQEFFADGRFKVNFICSIGYGDPSKTFERSPRFAFDDVCKTA
jgi:3-hydroxypropanoate dehydrogenase